MSERWPNGHREAGQVTPLIAVGLVVMAAIGVVVVAVGGVISDRATARTAADAAALAAAAHLDPTESDAAAAHFARANGAELLSIHRQGHQVEVEVRVGRATARARAEAVLEPEASGAASIP